MQAIDGIFYIAILIMSVIVHEFAHGYVAYLCGDDTARFQNRLTLNPLKHLDPFGSVLLPLFLFITTAGKFTIGWAKPVPYNPNNLRNGKRGEFFVSIAGILANLSIAIIFGLIIRFAPHLGIPLLGADGVSASPFLKISSLIVLTNLLLALFNLIPIPPLDGSKILFAFLPARSRYIEAFLERWGMFFLLFFIVFLWSKVAPLIYIAFSLITGMY